VQINTFARYWFQGIFFQFKYAMDLEFALVYKIIQIRIEHSHRVRYSIAYLHANVAEIG